MSFVTSFAFKPADADWIEIGEAGTRLPGAGEFGEDVVMSHAFVLSLPEEARAVRGFVPVVIPDPPEGKTVIGWTTGDVDGVPTRIWQIEPEA